MEGNMSELLAVKLWLQPTWPGVQLETTTRHDFSKRLFSPEVPNLRGADWYLLQDHSVLGQPQKTTLFLFIKRKCEIYFIKKRLFIFALRHFCLQLQQRRDRCRCLLLFSYGAVSLQLNKFRIQYLLRRSSQTQV